MFSTKKLESSELRENRLRSLLKFKSSFYVIERWYLCFSSTIVEWYCLSDFRSFEDESLSLDDESCAGWDD